MSYQTTTAEEAVRGLLDEWATGIAEHRPRDVAALFTPDALFQGFDPTPGFDRDHVAAYYSKQPVGLTAAFDLIATRELAAGVVLGYARVLFARPDGPVPVFLTVVAERSQDGWALSHYHVSKILEA